jgi:hypothetical protein
LRSIGAAYSLANVNSGKCFDLPAMGDGTTIAQRNCTGSSSQTFNLKIGIEGSITNVQTAQCAEVQGGVTNDSTPIDGWTCHAGDNQTWTIKAISSGACTPESDRAFCTRLAIGCDRSAGVDNCGTTRTVVCGPCIPLQQSCAIVKPSTCTDIGKTNLARGGTVTASNAGGAPTDMTMAFDGDATTEWFIGASTGWIAYQFASGAKNLVTSYSVTSATSWQDTDPKSWTLEGANAGGWTVLDTRTNQAFENRGQTNYYTFNNATAYNRYRLNISVNNGSTNLHLAEIQLFR